MLAILLGESLKNELMRREWQLGALGAQDCTMNQHCKTALKSFIKPSTFHYNETDSVGCSSQPFLHDETTCEHCVGLVVWQCCKQRCDTAGCTEVIQVSEQMV